MMFRKSEGFRGTIRTKRKHCTIILEPVKLLERVLDYFLFRRLTSIGSHFDRESRDDVHVALHRDDNPHAHPLRKGPRRPQQQLQQQVRGRFRHRRSQEFGKFVFRRKQQHRRGIAAGIL